MGWTGLTSQLLSVLRAVDADRDPRGLFLITGTPAHLGVDPAECVVAEDTCWLQNGQPRLLASLLARTPHGLAVHVIA